MLDYSRQKVRTLLRQAGKVVMATAGPGGVQAGEYPCEADGLTLFIMVPRTSDHLYNLEFDARVTVLAGEWELQGWARAAAPDELPETLTGVHNPEAQWSTWVAVAPRVIRIHAEHGWGYSESIDLDPGGAGPG